MKKIINNNTSKKIILVLVIMILCNFIIPSYSHADNSNILFDPVKWLLKDLADIAISVVNLCFTGEWVGAGDAKAQGSGDWKNYWAENGATGYIDWPTIFVSPEEIFRGKVMGLNVNFITRIKDNNLVKIQGDNITGNSQLRDSGMYGTNEYKSALTDLRGVIAGWYLLIRNVSAAALLCVLIYVGIRMLISSVSEERAKYKAMIINWLVAICLVFFLHYIMAIIMYVTDKAVEVIDGGLGQSHYQVRRGGNGAPESFTLKKSAKLGGGESDGSGTASVYNLMELVRVYVSLENRLIGMGYLFVYIVLIIYTVVFVVKYIKRFIYMAFLTMIAPLIAFTYPIDKIKDGSAQAFNKWFIEYVFNALLQPLHLLIYVVLVGSAGDLVSVNFIYTIVALAFISKAENLVKDMFGFNKASTPPSPGGSMLAANVAQGAYNRIRNGAGKAANAIGSGKSGGESGGSSNSKVRQKTLSDVYGNNSNGGGSGSGASQNSGGSQTRIQETPSADEGLPGSESSSMPLRGGSNSSEGQTPTSGNRSQPSGGGTPPSNEEKRKIRAPRALAQAAGKGLGRTALRAAKFTGKKVGRGAVRAAAFAATAVPTLAAGAVAYAATGEAKYLGMGLGAAHAVAGRAADAVVPNKGGMSNSVVARGGRAIRTAYRKEKLGSDGAAAQEKFDKFTKDKDNLKKFREQNKHLGLNNDKDTKKYLEDNAKDYIAAGYDNVEDVSRLMKMEKSMNANQKNEDKMTSDQIMLADKMASETNTEQLMNGDKSVELENRMTEQIKSLSNSSDDGYARKEARKQMNAMRVSRGLATVSDTDANNARTKYEQKQTEKKEQMDLLRQIAENTSGRGPRRRRRNR